jgi:serine protease Do
MKLRSLSLLLIPAACAAAVPAAADAAAAAPKSPAVTERRELRVLSTPDRERRLVVETRAGKDGKVETEEVTFLGVETSPVSGALASQLGLADGAGLVVNHLVPKSAAAGVLAVHDVLLKLDDQILIETRQLAVLIRGKKEGDEVSFTYLRGGKSATAKVKLGKREVPKLAAVPGGGPTISIFGGGGPDLARADADRTEVDRVLGLLKRAREGGEVREEIMRGDGPGFRVMSINTGNSTLNFNDDEGSIELTLREGAKSVVAKDRDGKVVFSGPANSAEERKAMPAEVRARLDKVEGMREMSFRTDGEFQGVQNRTMRPRGISLPPGEAPRPAAGARLLPLRVL